MVAKSTLKTPGAVITLRPILTKVPGACSKTAFVLNQALGLGLSSARDWPWDDIRPVQIEFGAGLILPVGEVDRSAGLDRDAGA